MEQCCELACSILILYVRYGECRISSVIFGGNFTRISNSTVSPRGLELSFIQVQWRQEVMLFPRIETSQLIALQALLALLQPLRPRPTLKRLVQDQGNTLTHLREGERRGPFFSPDRFPAPRTTWPGT